MKHILDEIGTISKLTGKRKILLMLDYDGTVVPIAKTPGQAILPKNARILFKNIAKDPSVKLSFISGRSLSEIKKMAQINGIFYAGNHGLEIEGPGISFVHKKAKDLSGDLRRVFEKLTKSLCDHKGVLIEDKNLSISVHYRLADRADEKNIKALVRSSADKTLFRLSGGKKVIEIRPKEKWDKGDAARFLLKKFRDHFPVYIGDDITDEDAFRALKGKGLTVFVGPRKKSAAGYFLNDYKEVRAFIRMIGQRDQTQK